MGEGRAEEKLEVEVALGVAIVDDAELSCLLGVVAHEFFQFVVAHRLTAGGACAAEPRRSGLGEAFERRGLKMISLGGANDHTVFQVRLRFGFRQAGQPTVVRIIRHSAVVMGKYRLLLS